VSERARIQRQNEIIEALIDKVESTYNPLSLKSFLDSAVHDIAIDKALGLGELYSLASTYHAFSPSKLKTYTLPTTPVVPRTRSGVRAVEVYSLHAMGRETIRVRHFYHHALFTIHRMDGQPPPILVSLFEVYLWVLCTVGRGARGCRNAFS